MTSEKKYLFGPVPSRRLGLSLGIDLVRAKTCTQNCVYCEAGATTDLTLDRREYVPVDEVLRQLDAYLATGPELDYVTFSGSGEPTLNSRIGEVVEFMRTRYPQYRLCLLTNGSLLDQEAVARAVERADLIIPSLDASNEEEFQKVNRPVPGYTLDRLVRALASFRRRYRGAYWLELFMVPGVNDTAASLERFTALVKQIAPDKVQLNTLDRPGCVDWIEPASEATVLRFLEAIGPVAAVEAVGKFRHQRYHSLTVSADAAQRVLELVKRRPCTAADISASLGVTLEHAVVGLEEMASAGQLARLPHPRGMFYSLPDGNCGCPTGPGTPKD